MKKVRKSPLLVLLCLCVVGLTCCAGINAYVVGKTKARIRSAEEAASLGGADCILVLGCAVWNGDTLSPMLRDRVLTGIGLYENGASDRLLMSGDHGRKEYDEVNNMKRFCVDRGIEPDVIFLDHAGFSTYDSMYRSKAIFGVKKVIIVTQKYHLFRAIYIARALGIDAYGVPSDLSDYTEHTRIRNAVREALARCKDFFVCLIKPEPTYLGEAIPISGSASPSDDREYA